jgi:hypothetical protein
MPADTTTAAEVARPRGGSLADALRRALERTTDGDLKLWLAALLQDDCRAGEEVEQRETATSGSLP